MIPSHKISFLSKVVLIIGAGMLVASLFTPLWRIELDAPQYPEGLVLLIFTNKLGGDVDIINGLNHYIGMATLHAENFVEFTVLPYIISFFAIFTIVVALIGRRTLLLWLCIAFILFGIVAMADFWRWEYNYGHNLDPNAAIIVPGMAYQPPLIGFKQLLNFGAYSIPDVGGWLFIAVGVLILMTVVYEYKFKKSNYKSSATVSLALILISMNSCGELKPEPIALNKDVCTECKMTIADPKFACEIVTKKGRVYKFDDIACMRRHLTHDNSNVVALTLVGDFVNDHALTAVTNCYFVVSEIFKSPMQGNIAAFSNKTQAEEQGTTYQTKVLTWNDIIQ